MAMVVLLGPVDTDKEIKAILGILQKERHLDPNREFTDSEVRNLLVALKTWRFNRVEGPVDTPREIEVFLGLLRKQNLLSVELPL